MDHAIPKNGFIARFPCGWHALWRLYALTPTMFVQWRQRTLHVGMTIFVQNWASSGETIASSIGA